MQDGYPTDYVTAPYQPLCVAWDPVTRLPKRNSSDIYPSYGETVALGGRDFQFTFHYYIQNTNIGDYITVLLLTKAPCMLIMPGMKDDIFWALHRQCCLLCWICRWAGKAE